MLNKYVICIIKFKGITFTKQVYFRHRIGSGNDYR